MLWPSPLACSCGVDPQVFGDGMGHSRCCDGCLKQELRSHHDVRRQFGAYRSVAGSIGHCIHLGYGSKFA